MRDKLEAIKAEALAKIESAEVVSTLNDVKVAILGKKGELTQVLKSMKDVAPEDRPKVGQMVNEARQAIETALDEKTKSINQGTPCREDEERDNRCNSSRSEEAYRTQTSKPDST